MAHFAEIDNNNVVSRVIVISDDIAPDPAPDNESAGQAFIADVLGLSGTWLQTSYNGNFRGRYAGTGDTYDPVNDVFVPPQPYPSWVLNTELYEWEPPTPKPDDGQFYVWSEQSVGWIVP